MDRIITMRDIFAALTKELGEAKGRDTFAWYCTTYGVTIADIAPAVVRYEVLGFYAAAPQNKAYLKK